MLPYPDQLELSQVPAVKATAQIPGSKSITNRAYVLAALANGTSEIVDPLYSDDTEAMSGCLSMLGVSVDATAPERVKIGGVSGVFATPAAPLFVGNSGTTIRFLTAAAILAPNGITVTLDGIARMRERPIIDLVEAMQQLGVQARTAANGCPPVEVVGGGFHGGTALIKGSLSSQYLSALLMSAPYAANDVTIEVAGDLVSKPYVTMTLAMMKSFGVTATNHGFQSFTVPCGQVYTPLKYTVEPDASNASYFLAAAAVTGGHVKVLGLGTSSIQGDVVLIDVLQQMGCTIDKNPNSLSVTGPAQLSAVDFDASSIPDMAQTIAVVALFANGITRLTGLKTLRVKETDRIHALAIELSKFGAKVTEGSDYLLIDPPRKPAVATVDTYDDHRMAMSFAIAGLRVDGVTINNPSCVAKTFPDFWSRWEKNFPGAIRYK